MSENRCITAHYSVPNFYVACKKNNNLQTNKQTKKTSSEYTTSFQRLSMQKHDVYLPASICQANQPKQPDSGLPNWGGIIQASEMLKNTLMYLHYILHLMYTFTVATCNFDHYYFIYSMKFRHKIKSVLSFKRVQILFEATLLSGRWETCLKQ